MHYYRMECSGETLAQLDSAQIANQLHGFGHRAEKKTSPVLNTT